MPLSGFTTIRAVAVCASAALVIVLLMQNDASVEVLEEVSVTGDVAKMPSLPKTRNRHQPALGHGAQQWDWNIPADQMLAQAQQPHSSADSLIQRSCSDDDASLQTELQVRLTHMLHDSQGQMHRGLKLEELKEAQRSQYSQLRERLKDELAHSQQKLEAYKKLRKRSIQADRYCVKRMVSECQDSAGDYPPECHMVLHQNRACRQAQLLAHRAALHAPAVQHLKFVRAQYVHAADEADALAQEAKRSVQGGQAGGLATQALLQSQRTHLKQWRKELSQRQHTCEARHCQAALFQEAHQHTRRAWARLQSAAKLRGRARQAFVGYATTTLAQQPSSPRQHGLARVAMQRYQKAAAEVQRVTASSKQEVLLALRANDRAHQQAARSCGAPQGPRVLLSAEASRIHHSTAKQLATLQKVIAAVGRLPKAPWVLSHHAQLRLAIRSSLHRIHAYERNKQRRVGLLLGADRDAIRTGARVAKEATGAHRSAPSPWRYLHHAKESASKIDEKELQRLAPGASNKALQHASVQRALRRMRLSDRHSRWSAAAQEKMLAAVPLSTSVMTEDAPAASAQQAAAAQTKDLKKSVQATQKKLKAKVAAKKAQAQEDNKNALNNMQAQAKKKAAAVQKKTKALQQAAQQSSGADQQSAAWKELQAKRADMAKEASDAKERATKESARIIQQGAAQANREAKRLKKRAAAAAKRREKNHKHRKLLLAGLPKHLYHTGFTGMKDSFLRAKTRFEGHVSNAKAKLLRVQTRNIQRLQRTSGGRAAIRSARKLRTMVKDDNLRYHFQTVKLKNQYLSKDEQMREQNIHAHFKRAYRRIKDHNEYVDALRKISDDSKWRQRWFAAIRASTGRCTGLKGDAMRQCLIAVEQGAQPELSRLKANDSAYQKQVSDLRTKMVTSRKKFIAERETLHDQYVKAMQKMVKDTEEREVKFNAKKRKQLMINNGNDLGGTISDPETQKLLHQQLRDTEDGRTFAAQDRLDFEKRLKNQISDTDKSLDQNDDRHAADLENEISDTDHKLQHLGSNHAGVDDPLQQFRNARAEVDRQGQEQRKMLHPDLLDRSSIAEEHHKIADVDAKY